MKVNHESNKIVFTCTPIATQTFPTHETVGGLDKVDHHSNVDLNVNREAVKPAVVVDHVEAILK